MTEIQAYHIAVVYSAGDIVMDSHFLHEEEAGDKPPNTTPPAVEEKELTNMGQGFRVQSIPLPQASPVTLGMFISLCLSFQCAKWGG